MVWYCLVCMYIRVYIYNMYYIYILYNIYILNIIYIIYILYIYIYYILYIYIYIYYIIYYIYIYYNIYESIYTPHTYVQQLVPGRVWVGDHVCSFSRGVCIDPGRPNGGGPGLWRTGDFFTQDIWGFPWVCCNF